MLNLPILPYLTALLFQSADDGINVEDLPGILSSGTAIVVYIFVILAIIAVLVITVLVSGRDKGDATPLPQDSEIGRAHV